MHIHSSTITQKGQATIPIEIRKELDLQSGDKIEFEVLKEGIVMIKKMHGLDHIYHRSLRELLSEWDSPEDNEAFRDL